MHSPLSRDLEQLVVTVSIVIVLENPQRKSKKTSRKSIICNSQRLIKFKISDQREKNSVKITHIFSHHTNTFTPSKDQLVMVRAAAGDYGKFTSLIVKDLIKLIDLNHFVKSCLIR